MPDTKITDLAAAAGVHPADLFVLVDTADPTMAPTGTDKRLTAAQLLAAVAADALAGEAVLQTGDYPDPPWLPSTDGGYF